VLLGEEPTALDPGICPLTSAGFRLAPPLVPVGLPADLLPVVVPRIRPSQCRSPELAGPRPQARMRTLAWPPAICSPTSALTDRSRSADPNSPDLFKLGQARGDDRGRPLTGRSSMTGRIWSNIEASQRRSGPGAALLPADRAHCSSRCVNLAHRVRAGAAAARRAPIGRCGSRPTNAPSLLHKEAYQLGQKEFLNVIVAQESLLGASKCAGAKQPGGRHRSRGDLQGAGWRLGSGEPAPNNPAGA